MSALLHHFVYELRSGIRDRSAMMLNYLFPLLFFALAGALMGGINPGFVGYMVPAMSLFAIMSSFLLGMPPAVVGAREAGVLRSYRTNGVPGWTTLAMPVAANTLHMALVTVVIAMAGAAVMGAPAPQRFFVAGWVLAVLAIAGFGALISVVAGSGRSAILLAQMVFIPSIILGGLMTPPEILPSALSRLALLWPATHAMRIFRGDAQWQLSAIALGASSLLSFAVAGALYEWDQKNRRAAWTKVAALLPLVPFVICAVALR